MDFRNQGLNRPVASLLAPQGTQWRSCNELMSVSDTQIEGNN